MTTLFAYNTETMECVARIEGSTNEACEKMFADRFGGSDDFGSTYSPAFGTVDGLVAGESVEDIDADEQGKIEYNGETFDMNVARNLMDDELCETIHGTVDTDQKFFDAYVKAHAEKFGEEFVIN